MKKLIIFVLLITCSFSIYSQSSSSNLTDEPNENNSWNFNITPYLFAAGMEGEISFLSQSIPVDAQFSDLVDHLSFGAMLNAEANKGKWTIMTDFIYMKLKNEGTLQNGQGTAKAELEQIIFELGGGYKFIEEGNFTVDVIAGARFFNLDNSLTLQEFSILDKNISFTDPYLGLRYKTHCKKWKHSGRIDLGGFDIGSRYSWKFNLMLGYDVSKTITLALGYQGYGVDYREDKNDFKYDIFSGGGVFGLNFHF